MNNSAKYIFAALILAVGVVGISFYSCEKEEIAPNATTVQPIQEDDPDHTFRSEGNQVVNFEMIESPESYFDENLELILSNEMCDKPIQKEIMSKSTGLVGKAVIYNSENFLNVLLFANEPFTIDKAKLMVRPANEGMPKEANPETFTISTPDDREPMQFAGFRIPIGEVSLESMIAGAVHLLNEEGKPLLGWIHGETFGTTMLGQYFSYSLMECTVPAGDVPATEASNEEAR